MYHVCREIYVAFYGFKSRLSDEAAGLPGRATEIDPINCQPAACRIYIKNHTTDEQEFSGFI